MEEMEALAREAAAAMAALGSCGIGTWQQRLDALIQAGEYQDSGFDEVLGWFEKTDD